MRKSPTLQVLFPGSRADILSACMLQPDRWWYLSELAAHLSTRPSSLQRDLKSLTTAGILEQRRDGRRCYVKANSEAPTFPELRGLMEKTAGLPAALKLLLDPFREKILCAFVFGSVARSTEHYGSDVDLMVVGEVGLLGLSPGLRRIEHRLGREVNATLFTAGEFRARAREHFLKTVLSGEKSFVIGDEQILGDITGEQRRAKARHFKKGVGKSSSRNSS